jgi:dolichol kinase
MAPLQRRVFHMVAASLFPTLFLFVPRTPLLVAAIALTVTVIAGEALRFKVPAVNRWLTRKVRVLMKEREHGVVFGSTYVLIATTVVIGVMDRSIAPLALFFLAFGDPAAAFIGERWGRHRFGKGTIEGSLAFLGAALAIGAVLLATRLDTTVPVMVVGVFTATIVEALPEWLDDNLTVPLAGGGAMALAAMAWG